MLIPTVFIALSSILALISAGLLYLSSPVQTARQNPLPRKKGWGSACTAWLISLLLLWHVMSFPAALSVVLILFMLGCMALAFSRGLWAAQRSITTDNHASR